MQQSVVGVGTMAPSSAGLACHGNPFPPSILNPNLRGPRVDMDLMSTFRLSINLLSRRIDGPRGIYHRIPEDSFIFFGH